MLMMTPPLLRYFWFHSINSLAASCSLRSAVCGLQSAVCSLQSAVCSLRFAVCSLQSAVWSLQMSYMSYIMKKQHLSSFVAGQGTLVPCVFLQTFKQALVAFLFVFVFFLSMKLHFYYSKKRINTICFGRRSILRDKKISASFQF